MKYLLLIALLVSGTSSFAKDINIKVNGMVCSLCGQGIKKKFSQVKEVKSIQVDMDNKLVQLTTEGDADLADEQIKTIITESGYLVASIERK